MYTIIGSGRVASHFSHYLRLEGLPFKSWARREHRTADLDKLLETSSHVLILISDDAVEEFIGSNPGLDAKILVHFSGSLISPRAAGAHPLMSFSTETYPLEVYRSIPFILEEGRAGFEDLLPGLSNPHFYIDPEKKALYHSLCVLSGNFTTLLWDKFFTELPESFDIPPGAAYPYLRGICRNLELEQGDALTGPLARGDVETVRRNLEALSGDPFEKIYRAFAEVFDLDDLPKAARKR